MKNNGTIALGLFCLGGICVVCATALSTASIKSEAILLSVIALIFIVFGFLFTHRYHQDEKALWDKKMNLSKKSSIVLKQAISALEDLQQAQNNFADHELVADKEHTALEAADLAVQALRGVSVSAKVMALSSLEYALRARARLDNCRENEVDEEETAAAQKDYDKASMQAMLDIQHMLAIKKDGFITEDL